MRFSVPLTILNLLQTKNTRQNTAARAPPAEKAKRICLELKNRVGQ